MLKKLCVVLSLLLSASAFGQRTISISATVAPALVRTNYNRTFLYPESDGQVVEPIFLAGMTNATGYSAGLTVCYAYAPGWSATAGIWYGQTTLQQARPVAGDGTTAIRSRAVRLPLLLNYQPLTRRLSPYFSLGLVLDFPLTSRVVVTRPGLPTQRLRLRTDAGPVFKPMLGAGGRYRLNDRFALIVQPVWVYTVGRFGGGQTTNSSYEVSVLTQVTYQF